jgi:hypothetical protein
MASNQSMEAWWPYDTATAPVHDLKAVDEWNAWNIDFSSKHASGDTTSVNAPLEFYIAHHKTPQTSVAALQSSVGGATIATAHQAAYGADGQVAPHSSQTANSESMVSHPPTVSSTADTTVTRFTAPFTGTYTIDRVGAHVHAANGSVGLAIWLETSIATDFDGVQRFRGPTHGGSTHMVPVIARTVHDNDSLLAPGSSIAVNMMAGDRVLIALDANGSDLNDTADISWRIRAAQREEAPIVHGEIQATEVAVGSVFVNDSFTVSGIDTVLDFNSTNPITTKLLYDTIQAAKVVEPAFLADVSTSVAHNAIGAITFDIDHTTSAITSAGLNTAGDAVIIPHTGCYLVTVESTAQTTGELLNMQILSNGVVLEAGSANGHLTLSGSFLLQAGSAVQVSAQNSNAATTSLSIALVRT